jgi:hypothetical protein
MGVQGGVGGMGMTSSTGDSGQSGSTSSFFGNQNGVQGAFIAGVAATSRHESIRIWQKHHHYDEWEFLGIDMGAFGGQVGMPGGSSGPTGLGQQPTSQGSGFSLGSSQGSFGYTSPPTNPAPSQN